MYHSYMLSFTVLDDATWWPLSHLLRYQHAMEALELVSVTQTHSRKAMLQAVQDAAWRHSFSPFQPLKHPQKLWVLGDETIYFKHFRTISWGCFGF